MSDSQSNLTRSPKFLFLELGAYSILFFSSYCFPFAIFYPTEDIFKTAPQYFWDFLISYFYIPIFMMVVFSLLSQSKWIINIVNVVSVLLLLLFALIIAMSFTWWGVSPFHPDYGWGLFGVQSSIFVLIVRSYTFLPTIKQYRINRKFLISSKILSITIPTALIIVLYCIYYIMTNAPIMRSGGRSTNEQGIVVISEDWDYLEHYNAFADKYYSEKKVNGNVIKTLDSVRFTFFNKGRQIGKRFTRSAKNGELDVEEILDEEEL